MALEVLASRILSPYFGSSVYVWGSIISTFLAALSVGYVLGGRFADRHPHLAVLGRLVLGAGVAVALVLLAGDAVAREVGHLTGGSPLGTLLAVAILFGPATVLFGMVSPWAVRLAARELGLLGNTAGRLYAISTAGSLAGTLACTFLLIPFLSLEQILGTLLAITAGAGALALVGSGRREWLAGGLALALVALSVKAWTTPSQSPGAIYRRITPYQTLQIRETEGVRYLVGDGAIQASLRLENGASASSYIWLTPAALLFNDHPERGLALGLGGGSCVKLIRSVRPEMSFDIVEIDPAVVDVAKRFLAFEPRSGDALHIDDARRFLEREDRRWDVIILDTYIGLSVPFHLTTTEFFDLVSRRLEDDGVLVLNLAGGIEYAFPRAVLRTLTEHLPQTYVFQAPRRANVVVFATKGKLRLSREDLAARANRLQAMQTSALPLSWADIAASQIGELELDVRNAPLLTDEKAPVERLIGTGEDNADLFRSSGED